MNRLRMTIAAMTVGALTLPMLAQDEPKGRETPPPTPTTPSRQAAPGERERSATAMRQQLSAEQLQRAWELEAKGTAARLGLDQEKTGKLVEAYTASRKSLQAESDKQRQALRDKMQAARDAGGEMPDRRALGAEMQRAIDEFASGERTKFQSALGAFLDAKQSEGAMQSLGAMAPMAFNQWDGMVHGLADFALEPEKNTQAMAAIEKYVISAGQLRGREGDDARAVLASARADLETSMKALLTEEQYNQFSRTMGGSRGRGDGPTRGADPRRGQSGQGGGTGAGTGGGAGGTGGGTGGGAGGAGGQGSGGGETPR